MNHRLTAHGVLYGTRCHRIDDFVFLPKHSPLGTLPERRRGKQPLRDEAHARGLDGDYGDIFHICGFPLTGLSYVLVDDRPIVATLRAFDLFRLTRIKQLGTLTDPVTMGTGQPVYAFRFRHTRYGHSIDVAAIATMIAWNNAIGERDRLHLAIASVIHDALTPAHGDGTKLIDPEAFDEDAHIGELFDRPEWPELKAKYDLDETFLIDIVQERGILGEIKKWADRIAYIARDVMEYVIWNQPKVSLLLPYEHQVVRTLIRMRPKILHVWDTLVVRRGRLISTDPDALGDFLTLRVQMFQSLYYHPFARFREFVFSKVVVQYLYDTGKLTREMLLTMTDDDLEHVIDQTIGWPGALNNLDCLGTPKTMTCEDKEAKEYLCHQLRCRGIQFIFHEELTRAINPGTNFPVLHRRRIVPLSKARPRLAHDLAILSRQEHPFRVHWIENPAVSVEFATAYDHYLSKKAAR